MKTRTRRTPEELAAYHLAKANKARAKATRLKKEAEMKKIFDLGKAVMNAGEFQPADVPALLLLGQLLVKGFGKDGKITAGDSAHFSAVEGLFRPGTEDRRMIVEWWLENGHPMS